MGPMIKFPLESTGGLVRSGNSIALTNQGLFISRVGGAPHNENGNNEAITKNAVSSIFIGILSKDSADGERFDLNKPLVYSYL